MRNYVQMFWAKVDYDVDVNPPNPVIPEVIYIMGKSVAELASLVETAIADLQTDPRTQNFRTTNKGPLYFLMDKTNLAILLASAGNAAMQAIDLFNTYPSYVYSGPNNTPRDGWTDNDGIKRKPPPSDRPASTKKAKAGTQDMSLLSYLIRLHDTWLTGTNGTIPPRWIEWLELLIVHYSRYTPTQIYGFLNRVVFSSKTFRV